MLKKIGLAAMIQAVVIFFIIGVMTYIVKGDFFYQGLAPIFAVIAGLFRLMTAFLIGKIRPDLYQDSKSSDDEN